MHSSPPTVLAIGSCRIFRPLRRLHQDGLITLVNREGNQWFTHTSAAARQYVGVLDGSMTIPEFLRRAALETDAEIPQDMTDREGLKADVAVIEVSSLKRHRVDSIELNAHKVYGIALESGEDYRPIIQGDVSRLPNSHVLKPMTVSYADQNDLIADLTLIRDRLQIPILTVNHLYSELPDGNPAPDRVRLTTFLRAAERILGIRLHDTEPAIREAGIPAALLDQNHYRKDFEPTVATSLISSIEEILNA